MYEQRLRRYVAVADTGAFYAAHRTQYRIERWSWDGALTRVYTVEMPGFDTEYVGPLVRRDRPIPSLVTNIWTDSKGLVWVIRTVADHRYQEAVEEVVSEGKRQLTIRDQNRYYDAYLDVLDLAAGQVVASRRFDFRLFLVGKGLFFTFRSRNGAANGIDIWRMELGQPTVQEET